MTRMQSLIQRSGAVGGPRSKPRELPNGTRSSSAAAHPMRARTARTLKRGARRGRRKGVSAKDLAHLTSQLAVLLEARIPIVDGIRSIAEQETNPRLREVMEDAATQIEGGSTVTNALAPHRDLFGDIYVETVRAAEVSGNMVEILGSLAEMLDRQYETSRNVKGALMYPICVIAALGLAVTFLMIFVVPRFATMFASRGMELPVPTKILMSVSGFMRDEWYVVLGVAVGGAWLLKSAWRHPLWRTRIDTALHVLPFVRSMLKGAAISRFSQILGISVRSGLSLLDALEMAGRASGRPLLAADAERMRSQVNQGGRLADVMPSCAYLTPFSRRMLKAGEEAADLSRMCTIIARHYDREVSHLAKNVTTVVEPIMIVGLAGIVLLISLAIFLPMWNMAALMS